MASNSRNACELQDIATTPSRFILIRGINKGTKHSFTIGFKDNLGMYSLTNTNTSMTSSFQPKIIGDPFVQNLLLDAHFHLAQTLRLYLRF